MAKRKRVSRRIQPKRPTSPKKKTTPSTPKKQTTSRKPKRKAKAKQKPLWALDQHGITNSGLQKWMECPEQFALAYIEGLRHVRINEPMEFGSLFHLCLENRGNGDPLTLMKDYREQSAEAHSNNHNYMMALDHLIHQVNAIMPAYEKAYPIEKEHKVANNERSFAVPVRVLNVDFTLRGKIDSEIIASNSPSEEETSPRLALKEIKTKTTIDKDKIRYLLKCDLQTLIYLWAMRRDHGHCPAFLLYDVVKRPTLKVTRGETLKQHYERVRQHAMDRADMYFFRWKVDPVTDDDLDRFEHNILMPLLSTFVSWWLEVRRRPFNRFESPLHHLNLSALSDPWRRSEYYDYLVLGDTTSYTKKSSPHQELSE